MACRRDPERKTSQRPTAPAKARLFAAFVSAHLSDVPHLILKVTDRPLTGHHLPLSLRDALLDIAGHFGLRVLQRCLWDPIGHVSVGLGGWGGERERESRVQVSADVPADSHLYCISVFVHLLACTHVRDASVCIFALGQVFQAPVPLSTGKRRLGTSV